MAEKELWPRDIWRDAMWNDPGPDPAMRAVATAYGRYAGAGDVSWVVREELFLRTGIRSKNTLKRAIDLLIIDKWLVLFEPARQHKSPKYRLLILGEPMLKTPVDKSPRGSDSDPLERARRSPEGQNLTARGSDSDPSRGSDSDPKSSKGSSKEASKGEPPADRPAMYCPKHPNDTDRPCTPCREARIRRQRWDELHAAATPIPPRFERARQLPLVAAVGVVGWEPVVSEETRSYWNKNWKTAGQAGA